MTTRKRTGARLGQHFLNAPWVAHKLIDAARITEKDTVLEIGPGKGALTEKLLERAGRVVALEKDPALAAHLGERFTDAVAAGKLVLVTDDVRNVTPQKLGLTDRAYILAANIPYYITGEILRTFLTTSAQPMHMALLMQKEVVDRIIGRERESILSLSVKAYGTPHRVAVVSRACFTPPPSVDSAILAVTDISRSFFENIDEAAFFSLLHAGFASKRKYLSNNLRASGDTDAVAHALQVCTIPERARAEELSLEQWACLAQQPLLA